MSVNHKTPIRRFLVFFFNDPATTEIYTLSLHDALPIRQFWPLRSLIGPRRLVACSRESRPRSSGARSEEHTSELQSQFHLVCRLLLEKKKNNEECQDAKKFHQKAKAN